MPKKKTGKKKPKKKAEKKSQVYQPPKATRADKSHKFPYLSWCHKPGERRPFIFGQYVKMAGSSNPPETQEAITLFLRKHNLNVAKIHGLKGRRRQAVLSRRLGDSLYKIMEEGNWKHSSFGHYIHPGEERLAREVDRSVADQLAKLLGKMHALGVTHQHPHQSNVTWHEGKVGLIDFKYARKTTFKQLMSAPLRAGIIGTNLPANDYNSFKFLLGFVLNFKSWREKRPFFKTLVDQYPLTKKEKERRLKEIEDAIKRGIV